MNEYAERLKPFYHFAEKILFPVILILFPLLKVNQGIDLTDTAYSLGNYAFFGQNTVLWTLLTFLSNVLGFFFTKLPFGGTMLGMKVYSSLLISAMALLGYRFFRTKMPAVIVFLAELSAIGMCWCPSVILYNYMTYALLLTAVILLFRGLVRKHPGCLVAAGVVLGLNTLVRFPNNGLEVLLILTLWYYGYLKKKPLAEIAKETGLCIAGYAAGFVAVLAGMMLLYGTGTLGTMIEGVFGMAGSASDYTFGEMLGMITDAYLHGAGWMAYMVLCILPGIPFFAIQKERFPLLRKVVYCICIVFLFIVLGRWGMFNFKYYQKDHDEQYGEVDDFKDNNVEVTEELLEAISLLNTAISQNYEEDMRNEKEVKLSEYELQKIYFELLRDVVLDEHLSEMSIPYSSEDDLISYITGQ